MRWNQTCILKAGSHLFVQFEPSVVTFAVHVLKSEVPDLTQADGFHHLHGEKESLRIQQGCNKQDYFYYQLIWNVKNRAKGGLQMFSSEWPKVQRPRGIEVLVVDTAHSHLRG